MTRIAEDDQLLDALGRGEAPDGEDQVAALLGEWRAALPETCPVEELPDGPPRRRVRRSLVAAAVVLVAAGGVTAAAERAEPGSPLWPVTRLLYDDLADSRAARQAADEAVTVAAEATEGGHYDRAAELLDQADALVVQVDEPETADQLRGRIAAVRARIATATSAVPEGIPGGIPGRIPEEIPEAPATDPPPADHGPPPAATPEPSPGPDNSPENGPGNGHGNGPPPRVLPTVPDVPVPGVGPGE